VSGYTHLNDSWPVARKPHKCRLCGLSIEKGEKHLARRGAFEGTLFTDRMHSDCNQVTVDHNWHEEEWEYLDVQEFNRELKEWKEKKGPAHE